MIKILSASKDTYINNRNLKGIDVSDSNVGRAPTLDLFKITTTDVTGSIVKEISRILIKFDLDDIKTLSDNNIININDTSFNAKLELFNVTGGQTLPSDFTIRLCPLSKSFDEGLGRDIILYNDIDAANFITASTFPTIDLWVSGGAGCSGSANQNVDFISTFEKNLLFKNGNEDLILDVTDIVSSSITNQIPNSGFILTLHKNHEEDEKTYYVKRFASRHAFNKNKHPRIVVSYDDSIKDDLNNLDFNVSGSTFLYNYIRGSMDEFKNIFSGSTEIIGNNCILFNLKAKENSNISFSFTGSQHEINGIIQNGIYRSDFVLSETQEITDILSSSGSINFIPSWKSLDNAITYKTLDTILFSRNQNNSLDLNDYYITCNNQNIYSKGEFVRFYINIFKKTNFLKLVKKPIQDKGVILNNLFYSIRDIESGFRYIDFSDGTKLSNDINKLFLDLDTSNLIENRTYVIDLMYKNNLNQRKIFENVSMPFTIKFVID